MAKLEATPEEIRNFRGSLLGYNERLKDQTISLKANFDELSQTWQDNQQQKFANEFETLEKLIQSFLANSDDFVLYLEKKSIKIDTYLER